MTVLANARQTVAAPVRKPRRYGLFSVADVIDGGEAHWMLGGLTADGEECSTPVTGTIDCGPSAAKSARSWYSDIEGDPWMTYMYETCKTIGRFAEASQKLRQRFEAAEQSSVEAGFTTNILSGATDVGALGTVAQAIGALEGEAGREYGGQIILHLPFEAAADAARQNMLVQSGSQLQTPGGNLVSVGNYAADAAAGATVYATGAVVLYRSALSEVPPQYAFAQNENDYYTLIERAYAALVDCFMAKATATLCGCGV